MGGWLDAGVGGDPGVFIRVFTKGAPGLAALLSEVIVLCGGLPRFVAGVSPIFPLLDVFGVEVLAGIPTGKLLPLAASDWEVSGAVG
jgi:hypothetical protein